MKTDRKRILVVDDQASDTRLVKRYLEECHDYIVAEENDAQAAVSTAEKFRPDLILLDLIMPDVDGMELAAAFEKNLQLQAVPIVFLTSAITKVEVEAVGGRIGKFPFLAKPIQLGEVAACLERHLKQ